MSEVWVTRGEVSQWPAKERENIFSPYNMVFLTAQQNMGMTKEIKLQAALYLVGLYGCRQIDFWLKNIGIDRTVTQILKRLGAEDKDLCSNNGG